jgi:hypothetical protein
MLLIKRIPAYSRAFSTFSILELRTLVDTGIDILHGLDQGNETLIKCQDTLRKLLIAMEIDGNEPNPASKIPRHTIYYN